MAVVWQTCPNNYLTIDKSIKTITKESNYMQHAHVTTNCSDETAKRTAVTEVVCLCGTVAVSLTQQTPHQRADDVRAR